MEECAWQTTHDLKALLRLLRSTFGGPPDAVGIASRRKLILFAVAICNSVRYLVESDWHQLVLDTVEQSADTREIAPDVWRALDQLYLEAGRPTPRHTWPSTAVQLGRDLATASDWYGRWHALTGIVDKVEGTLEYAWGRFERPFPSNADLLHCIIGNPFHPVTFTPSWRSETVVALATGIYADRAFDRLPVLADALEEAGCDNADVLSHCRGPGPHARGCWVVDGVLGKE